MWTALGDGLSVHLEGFEHWSNGHSSCSVENNWMKQLWDIYTMEFYLAIKKKKILPFATVWMNLENILLSEICQSGKDKYHMILLICEI